MLDIVDLKKSFRGMPVIDGVNLHVGDHEIVAIVGPSGCGKSTLLNLIAGISKGHTGEIRNHAEKTGYVFQEDRILPWLTVYDNIKIVRPEEDREKINSLIAKMKLDGFERYYPHELSGGMRQRCGIARAFYYGSRLLLMDEPFKSLDYNLRIELLQHLLVLWETEKPSVIFVTHDIEEAIMIADRILVMKNRPTTIVQDISLPERTVMRDITSEYALQLKADLVQYLV